MTWTPSVGARQWKLVGSVCATVLACVLFATTGPSRAQGQDAARPPVAAPTSPLPRPTLAGPLTLTVLGGVTTVTCASGALLFALLGRVTAYDEESADSLRTAARVSGALSVGALMLTGGGSIGSGVACVRAARLMASREGSGCSSRLCASRTVSCWTVRAAFSP